MILKTLSLCSALLLTNVTFANQNLVKLNKKTYAFEGLTQEGLEKIKELRDSLRQNNAIFNNTFLNLETVYHASLLTRANKENMLLYGPPGGAKSALVKWTLKGEKEPAFQMQLHQMVTEQAFTGGQDFEKAKLGQYIINTQGSLADYTVGLIDEAEKGNPATLASLLSLLEEREVMVGHTVVKARTESIFATSNANLPEIFEQFALNGQSTTAAAFLNRFRFKVFAYNWLDEEQREKLLNREKKKRLLKSVASVFAGALNDEVFLEAQNIDWESLRFLSSFMIKTSKIFDLSYNELFEKMRDVTHEAIEVSERNVRDRKEQFVYFPSCEFNTRNLLRIPSIIQTSAFIDFLLSDLANDLSIATRKPIELGVPSLWRAHLAMTTVGPGETKLEFNSENQQMKINFGWTLDVSKARDEREKGLIRNLVDEQKRFQDVLLAKYSELQKHIKLASRNCADSSKCPDSDFEFLIMKH